MVFPEDIFTSCFTKLTDVQFVLDMEDPEEPHWARVVSYINANKSPCLRRLTFIVVLTESDQLRDYAAYQRERDEWGRHLALVDALLAGDVYEALEELCLCIRPRWHGVRTPPIPLDRGLPPEDLRRMLPKLFYKGVKMFISPYRRCVPRLRT